MTLERFHLVKFSKEKNVQNVFDLNKNVVFRSLWGYHRKYTFLHIRIAIAELDNVGIVLSFFVVVVFCGV